MNRVLHSSKKQDHGTPPDEFAPIHRAMKFTVDVCAHEKNAKLTKWWGLKDGSLERSWRGERCWMNPPYDDLDTWLRKARHEVRSAEFTDTIVCCLLPCRPDAWWHEYVEKPAGLLLKSNYLPEHRVWALHWSGLSVYTHHREGRIPFIRPGQSNGAPFPSVYVVFAAVGAAVRLPREWGRKTAPGSARGVSVLPAPRATRLSRIRRKA